MQWRNTERRWRPVWVQAIYLALVICLGATTGCSKPTAADFEADDTTASLERYVGHIVRGSHSGNINKASDYIRALLPSTSDIRAVFKKSAEVDAVTTLHEGLSKLMSASDETLVRSFAPDTARTEVRAYAAAVDEIIRYERGSVAFAEFPGGTRRIAERYLKKDLTFYEVEVTEPGKDAGTKYHLFWVSNGRWKSLGPAWRILEKSTTRRR